MLWMSELWLEDSIGTYWRHLCTPAQWGCPVCLREASRTTCRGFYPYLQQKNNPICLTALIPCCFARFLNVSARQYTAFFTALCTSVQINTTWLMVHFSHFLLEIDIHVNTLCSSYTEVKLWKMQILIYDSVPSIIVNIWTHHQNFRPVHLNGL